MSKKKVPRISPATRGDFKNRNAKARRLIERGEELARSGSATDKRVARELFIEAFDLSAATIRDLEKISPALKALAKSWKRKASKK